VCVGIVCVKGMRLGHCREQGVVHVEGVC
jgi:hypothetical protein